MRNRTATVILTALCMAFAPRSVVAAGAIITGGFFAASSNMTAPSWVRPGSTLDLDFANDRYFLSGTTYSGLTNFITASGGAFSRSSSATYYDSSGTLQTAANDTPRIEHDSRSGAGRGVLIEESSTNVIIASGSVGTSPWAHGNGASVLTNIATAPDGTMTASLVTGIGSGNSYMGQNGLASFAGQTVTHSIFVKAGTTDQVYIEFTDSTACALYCVAAFNLTNQTASWNHAHAAQGPVTITALANGWSRISATLTTSSNALPQIIVYVGVYGTSTTSVYLWGAQSEVKAFATSYIPTTMAAVTRAADTFSFPTSGWFNSTTGTFAAQSYGQANSTQTGYGRVVGGEYPMAFIGYGASGTKNMNTWNSSTSVNSGGVLVYPTETLTAPVKMAHAWDQSSGTQSQAISGQLFSSAAYAGSWSSTNVYPGGSGYDPLNAPVVRMTFFPKRLADGALVNLTQ